MSTQAVRIRLVIAVASLLTFPHATSGAERPDSAAPEKNFRVSAPSTAGNLPKTGKATASIGIRSRSAPLIPAAFHEGNHHAASERWQQAQQAYFQASREDPGNPDILFNLAISLDHLDLPDAAASFYRQAIAAAAQRPAAFLPDLAQRRLLELAEAQ